MEDSFTCSVCHGTWLKGRTDAEAEAEREELFATEVAAGDEMDVVCDDCFNKIMKRLNVNN